MQKHQQKADAAQQEVAAAEAKLAEVHAQGDQTAAKDAAKDLRRAMDVSLQVAQSSLLS